MSTINWAGGTRIEPAELPAAIIGYLGAHEARDLDRAIPFYRTDAEVTDEDRTYRGRDEIRSWLGRAASEYTYTTTVTGGTKVDDEHYDVLNHLEGDFPGGVVDLHFRFTLAGPSIARLVIEP